MKKAYVYVRLDGWKHEWRLVQANSLSQAIEIANAMPDVVECLEASWIPGGVVT